MHWRVHRMLQQHEATARGAVRLCGWSRLEYTWLRAHPSIDVLREASRLSTPRCGLWVPLEEDYAGINDRHGFMDARVADVYFSRFEALMTGHVLNVLQCMRQGICAQSSERYLAATISYRNVTLCRFPPTGFLSCGGSRASSQRPHATSWGATTACIAAAILPSRGAPPSSLESITISGKYPREVVPCASSTVGLVLPGIGLSYARAHSHQQASGMGLVSKGASLVLRSLTLSSTSIQRGPPLWLLQDAHGAQWTLIETINAPARHLSSERTRNVECHCARSTNLVTRPTRTASEVGMNQPAPAVAVARKLDTNGAVQ